jgi:hypothetical protein
MYKGSNFLGDRYLFLNLNATEKRDHSDDDLLLVLRV